MNISIRQGHVLDRLKEIPDDSIDCIVTSSPYYGLRNYGAGEIVWDETVKCEHQWGETIPRQHETGGNRGVPEEWQRPSREAQEGSTAGNFCSKCNAWKGELGQEPSYKMFVKHLLQIAKELKRVLKPTGTMFWNLADSYSGSGGWNWNTSLYEKEQHLSMKHARANAYPSQALSAKTDIPKKSQMMIPERFAMGLIDEQGWIKRNTIIWYKRNGMPASVDDRLTNKWEPIFFFTKNQDYFFDLDAIRKPLSEATIQRIMQPNIENQFQTGKVADFAEQTQTGDMKKTLLNMQKRQLSSMSNEQKRNWFEKKQSEYDGKYSGMGSEESEMYNSKYDPGQNSYSANRYVKQIRDEARLEAEELFPDDSKAQQEYINMIHDHGGNPSGANPGDILKNDFTNSFFSDKAVLTAFMDFLYLERPELMADSILEITTRSHPFAHFAVYPETLVEPLIKAGCPSEVCSKCGKPKMKIMVKNGKTYDASTFEEREPYSSNRRLSDVVGVSETSTLRTNVIFGKDIIWKPTCKCNAEFIPGTVLDPFGGSGTTALVAKNLGRSAILIEAVPEYTEIMRKRLEMDEGETDTEFQEVIADIDDFEVEE